MTFAFPYDPGQLTGDTIVQPFFVTPQGTARAPGGDSQVTLHAVPLPTWLEGQADVYDPSQHAYVLTPDNPLGLNWNTTTSGFSLDFLNGLTTSLSAGLAVTVTAKLTTNPGDVILTPNSLTGSLTFLGQTVVAKNYSLPLTDIQTLEADLDPDTLDALDGITVATVPINLLSLITPPPTLYNLPFGTGNIPLPLPAPLQAGGSINVSGDFQAAAQMLTVQAGFHLDVSGSQPILVAQDSDGNDATYIKLRAVGSVSLVYKAQGSLGFEALPFPLISAVAAGGISAVADANIVVDFGGPLIAPTFSLNQAASWAGFTLGYGFAWNYGILNNLNVSDLKPVINTLGPYALFGLNAPPSPDFTALYNLIISGPGNQNTPGKPVLGDTTAAPTDGDQLLDSADIAKPSAAKKLVVAMADPASSPTSTLTVVSPIYGPVTDLKFGLDVLADQPSLTPGHEFLDTVLVGSDGSVVPLSHIDIATLPLSAGGSNLGYASGVQTIDVPVDSSQLALGQAYQIEFQLTTDSATTGHRVAVALQDLVVDQPNSMLSVTTPGAVQNGGTLDFGPVASGTATQTLTVANTGQATLVVNALSVSGAGFALVNPPTSGEFALP
ncbi:MAG: hypothetical protein WBX00_12495, partial [Isosphaeraceae bacterium]